MGRLLVALARDDARLRVTGATEAPGHAALGRDAGEVAGGGPLGVPIAAGLAAVCRRDAVVLDFTTPAATLAHARIAVERGAGLVVGTTGLDPTQDRELRALAASTRAVIAPNMSVGVTVLAELVATAARLLDASFEAEIVELHHHAKKDAPSGTALALAWLHAPPASHALRVGTSGDYPPFTLARKEGLTGFDVAVAHRFAHDSGRPLELVRFRWPELAGDLAAGRFDVAMGGITMRPERALVGSFTRPVLETAAVVLVRGEVAPTTADVDRPTTRLAVNAGGHLEQVARNLFPHALLVPSQNGALPELLRDGHADAVLTDDVEADVLAAVLPDASRLGPLP